MTRPPLDQSAAVVVAAAGWVNPGDLLATGWAQGLVVASAILAWAICRAAAPVRAILDGPLGALVAGGPPTFSTSSTPPAPPAVPAPPAAVHLRS